MFAYCQSNPVMYYDSTGTRNVMAEIIGGGDFIEENIDFHIMPSSPPTKGVPNSSDVLKKPDGSVKQKRWYDSKGEPIRDRDYDHTGDMDFPHDHIWENGKRLKDHLPPSPDYQIRRNQVAGLAMVSICIVGVMIVAIDDISAVGVINNGLLVPLSAGIIKGMNMITDDNDFERRK